MNRDWVSTQPRRVVILVLIIAVLEFGGWSALLTGTLARGHWVPPDTGTELDWLTWVPLISVGLAWIVNFLTVAALRATAFPKGCAICLVASCWIVEFINFVVNIIVLIERAVNIDTSAQSCKELAGVTPSPNCTTWLWGLFGLHIALALFALIVMLACCGACACGFGYLNGEEYSDLLAKEEEEEIEETALTQLSKYARPASSHLFNRTKNTQDVRK